MKDIKEIPQVRLYDAMNKIPPDYEEMEAAIKAGADVNAETYEDGDTLLSETYSFYLEERCFPGKDDWTDWKNVAKEKRINGWHLPLITKFFIDHGFDVNRGNGAYGATALYNLSHSTYDTYSLLTARMLLEAGADPDYKLEGFATVRQEIEDWLTDNDHAPSGEADWDKAAYLEKFARLCDLYADKPFDNLEKTKDLSFEVVAYGGGWEDYIFRYDNNEVVLLTTTIFGGYCLNALLEALCHFSPSFCRISYGSDEYPYFKWCEYPIRVKKERNKSPEWNPIYDYHSDRYEGGDIEYCVDIPLNVELSFDGEGRSSDIYLDRKPSADDEFDVYVRLTTLYEDGRKYYEFLVPYRKLCKTVADGCTQTLKKHGFYGWENSTFGQDFIDLKRLIFLKAIGYGKEEWLTVGNEGKGEGPKSNYHKEMELLDM